MLSTLLNLSYLSWVPELIAVSILGIVVLIQGFMLYFPHSVIVANLAGKVKVSFILTVIIAVMAFFGSAILRQLIGGGINAL